MSSLLAKSPRKGMAPITLEQHLRDTERAASVLFRPDTRWAENWVRFFRVAEADRERFLLHLRIAGLFHDIGKANVEFQDAMSGKGFRPQTIRHEHLSGLVLHLPAVRSWIERNPNLDHGALTAAVLSHHLKVGPAGPRKWCQPQGAPRLGIYLQHPEVKAAFEAIAAIGTLGPPPTLFPSTWQAGAPWDQAYQDGRRAARELEASIRRDPDRRAFLLSLKAGLIVSDSASSGLVREGHPIERWIEDVAHGPDLRAETIRHDILDPRARTIAASRGSFAWHRVQDMAGEQGPRALLLSACGTGKTLAAWRWAERQVQDRRLGHVLFLYPTRGTANEGYRDYVAGAPEGQGTLLHASSRYALEAMRTNPNEGGEGEREAQARLYSLGHWNKRYVSATVDQVLGFLEHQYGPTCLLPLVADSAIVFDEIHSFDDRMFERLLAFLHTFDVPVLCMTATLQTQRLESLVQSGLRAFPSESEREGLPDLEQQEQHPRYRLERSSEDEALPRAIEAYGRGERVLWVVNRVSEAQRLARKVALALGSDPLCYHSRFRFMDRQRIHDATVRAFSDATKPVFAITTQVCEMSLDLDADFLVTEVAPVPSLVQRFGRANRHLTRGPSFLAPLLAYSPATWLPYSKADLAGGEALVSGLVGEASLSQRQLAEALDRYAPCEAALNPYASFLAGGYFAVPGDLRAIEDPGLTCVLDTDLPAVTEAYRQKQPIDGYTLPLRQSEDITPGPTGVPRYVWVAPAEHYDPLVGYCR
jgi:CRISPR-associated endonuclease/helicase Cas3